jgi:hypothetical protein
MRAPFALGHVDDGPVDEQFNADAIQMGLL